MLVRRAHGRRQRRVDGRVPLPGDEGAAEPSPQVRPQPEAAGAVVRVDEGARKAARHARRHAGQVLVGEAPVEPDDLVVMCVVSFFLVRYITRIFA
jgi:hypothetical protein